MRITRKIISSVLVVCMLASTSALSGFAAEKATETSYTEASMAIDNKYAYDKGDLGATYSPEQTVFKVWAPTASQVTLNRYATGSDSEKNAKDLGKITMDKLIEDGEWTGVWTATVKGDIVNTYYTYTITAKNVKGEREQTVETQDIYSKATGVNGRRSMVVDLAKTNPDGWESDRHVLPGKSTDSIVYELHIKDFSYDPASGVSEQNRGKYLAFTETGTTLNNENKLSTCIDYLKELGITTVQLNPFYDFQSINEADSDKAFNWGYDPQNYNVPEGSYSSNPYDGNVRIAECKAMIKALHDAGLSVVMDVVYNHTYSVDSSFNNTVPNYYYRMLEDGSTNGNVVDGLTYSSNSGCGNDCATERAMYRDFVIQSLRYWVDEYHVDGFRFDLMGLMDVETMNLIRENLDEVDSGITLWGEGWSMDTFTHSTTCTGQKYLAATQTNSEYLDSRIALFSDSIRDNVKGSVWGIQDKGFIEGNKESTPAIRYGIQANTLDGGAWIAKAPSQTVTYADCHDNATMYDQIMASAALGEYGTRSELGVQLQKQGASIINTSQGISFMLAGQEMARTKFGDTNSYNSSPEINMIRWENLVDYADVVSYYKGLFKIRKAFSPFTADDNSFKDKYTIIGSDMNQQSAQTGFEVINDTEGEWNRVAVFHNSASGAATIRLNDRTVRDWVIVANGVEAGLENLGEFSDFKYKVPAHTTIIAVEKESFEKANLQSNTGKVKVNFVYDRDGSQLADPIVLKGDIGTSYQTAPSKSVPNIYMPKSSEGETSGVFTEEPKEVTYTFTDYVPERILNADFDNDGYVTISDVTALQMYLAELIELDKTVEELDLDYDGSVTISDATILQLYLADFGVGSGKVIVNYYYYDKNGDLKTIMKPVEIEGRVGDEFTTQTYRVVGYKIDETKLPEKTSGYIPYGEPLKVDYYYAPSDAHVTLHVKHSGSASWTPYFWIWGSNLDGVDEGNYSAKNSWPGGPITDFDDDGWYKYEFDYTGVGTYNVIINDNGSPQTIDYKGFIDNEMWIVINDDLVGTETQDWLTFYTDNPDKNPDAPIAERL